ncbi:uncharacterized protein LOC100887944 [Strongylocentrotus purpuratus]|uniref:Uncharacterized protein n=1 Tax=Strongylocentrotus purpuratus TaxID=7668 RepID=A0A7M7N4D1_STRPU|nr:uncharacterized protein LOC100887944 [Strongylocentrotus purpuratus]
MPEEGATNTFQMACTLAITRFVNLLTEEQQKFGRGKPVHEVALKIGLPKWIVDIRHQGTHGHMPKREVLESALRFGLNWLKVTFWEAHIKEMCTDKQVQDDDFDLKLREKIRGITAEYMDYMVNARTLVNGRPQHPGKEILQKLNKPLRNYASKNYLAYLLTQDGYLVPTPDQEKALCITSGMNDSRSEDLPTSLVNFWGPLLDFARPCGLEHLIIDSIINQLSRITSGGSSGDAKEGPVVRYLLGWAKNLMKRNAVTLRSDPVNRGTPPQKRNRREASEWSKTLKKCIEKPNKHNMNLLPCLLELQDPRLGKTAEETLIKIAKAMVHGPNGMTLPTNGLPSLDDIEAMIESRRNCRGNPMLDMLSAGRRDAQNRTVVDATDPWHVTNDLVDWSHTPLGVLPWQPDNPDFFQLSVPTSNMKKRKLSSDSLE